VAFAVPADSISPASLAFGPTAVGSTSAAQLVTIQNTGTGTMTLGTISFTGNSATAFLKSATTCGTSLAIGANCTISVEFKPTATGARTASLSIADNATGSPQLVPLKGTAIAAPSTVTISPASLAFGSTAVGSRSAAQLVTIENMGASTVTFSTIGFTGNSATAFLKSATTCSTSLAVGASCTISVEFKPTATGARTASLSIADNATGSPQLVPLKGTAIAAP
jgi:trimeric autotransporter adhesin